MIYINLHLYNQVEECVKIEANNMGRRRGTAQAAKSARQCGPIWIIEKTSTVIELPRTAENWYES